LKGDELAKIVKVPTTIVSSQFQQKNLPLTEEFSKIKKLPKALVPL
jgi:hypothetical protein